MSRGLAVLGVLLPAVALAELHAVVTQPLPVQLSGEGRVDAAQVSKVLASRQGLLQACFERELLHGADIQGKVVLTWRIRPDGQVENLRAELSTVLNPGVLSCLTRVVASMRFPAPSGGVVSVRHVVLVRAQEISRGSDQTTYLRPLSDPDVTGLGGEKRAPAASGPCRVTSGALPPGAASAMVGDRWQAISACLDIAPAMPADAGALARSLAQVKQLEPFASVRPRYPPQVEWAVSASGALSSVRVTRGGEPQPKIEACLRRRLEDWRFSPAAKGESVVICTFIGH